MTTLGGGALHADAWVGRCGQAEWCGHRAVGEFGKSCATRSTGTGTLHCGVVCVHWILLGCVLCDLSWRLFSGCCRARATEIRTSCLTNCNSKALLPCRLATCTQLASRRPYRPQPIHRSRHPADASQRQSAPAHPHSQLPRTNSQRLWHGVNSRTSAPRVQSQPHTDPPCFTRR